MAFKKDNTIIKDEYQKVVFKQKMFYNEEAIEPFTKHFLHDKSVDAMFYRLYQDGEILLSFKKVYHAYYYVSLNVQNAKYNFVKEGKNEFDEVVFLTNQATFDQKLVYFDNDLFKNNLLYNNDLLYEYEPFNDFLKHEDIISEQKYYSEFLKELDYKLVEDVKDSLYRKHNISEKSPLERIEIDPINSVVYEERLLILEPIIEISFDFKDGRKLKKYNNYVSLVTGKITLTSNFPLDRAFLDYFKRNRPGIFSDIRLDEEDLLYYMKEKYMLSLIVTEEFNKLNESEIIDRAVYYLENSKIEEGLLYIKKAFYLYGSKRVTKAFVTLAKFYLTKDNLDYKKALYYLFLSKNTQGSACYLIGSLMAKGLIEPLDYHSESIYYYNQALRKKDGEAAYALYYHYSNPRYLDNYLATKYLKIASKYKNDTAMKITGR